MERGWVNGEIKVRFLHLDQYADALGDQYSIMEDTENKLILVDSPISGRKAFQYDQKFMNWICIFDQSSIEDFLG